MAILFDGLLMLGSQNGTARLLLIPATSDLKSLAVDVCDNQGSAHKEARCLHRLVLNSRFALPEESPA
jgi:hypothetical protein